MGVETSSALGVALTASLEAGRLLMDYRTRELSGLTTKSSATDLVSDADRAAEELIVTALTTAFPDDGIVGEEGASSPGTSGRRWIIDPIDGTTNFVYGIDAFCVSIGLEDDRGPLAGCVHDPIRNQTFTAIRGGGAELDGRRISASAIDDLGQALVGTGFSYRSDQRQWQAAVVSRLLPQVRDIRRIGSAALDLCWVASGRLDAHVERGLAPWDHAAAALVAEEAGAAIRRPAGGESWGLVMACAAGIADELFELVDEAEAAAGPLPR